MLTQWQRLISSLYEYWQRYGGYKSLIGSPFLHIACIITILSYGYWMNNKWWEQVFSILPSLLGFTLAGFAIFLGFGSDDFKKIMSKKINNKSPYLDMVATYTHFVITQLLTLILAFILQGASNINPFNIPNDINLYLKLVSGFIGYCFMIYSLLLSISVCFSIFDLANVFSEFLSMNKTEKDNKNN